MPHLPVSGSAASAPQLPSGGPFPPRPSPSTLGSAAGDRSALPAGKRRLGLWLGIGAVVVVGGAVAAVMVAGGGHGAPPPPAGPGDAGVVATVPADAGSPRDAMQIAVIAPDARTLELRSNPEHISKPVPPRTSSGVAASSVAAQVELADRLNEEGKELLRQSDYEHAAKKFQQAIAHDGLAKYFFNLCIAQTSAGHLDEALTACNNVESHSPPRVLLAKAAQMIDKIKEIARSENIELHPAHRSDAPAR